MGVFVIVVEFVLFAFSGLGQHQDDVFGHVVGFLFLVVSLLHYRQHGLSHEGFVVIRVGRGGGGVENDGAGAGVDVFLQPCGAIIRITGDGVLVYQFGKVKICSY